MTASEQRWVVPFVLADGRAGRFHVSADSPEEARRVADACLKRSESVQVERWGTPVPEVTG